MSKNWGYACFDRPLSFVYSGSSLKYIGSRSNCCSISILSVNCVLWASPRSYNIIQGHWFSWAFQHPGFPEEGFYKKWILCGCTSLQLGIDLFGSRNPWWRSYCCAVGFIIVSARLFFWIIVCNITCFGIFVVFEVIMKNVYRLLHFGKPVILDHLHCKHAFELKDDKAILLAYAILSITFCSDRSL